MPSTDKRTISLPAEQANYIDTLVASGTYATASEVVRAGLRALQERDAAAFTATLQAASKHPLSGGYLMAAIPLPYLSLLPSDWLHGLPQHHAKLAV